MDKFRAFVKKYFWVFIFIIVIVSVIGDAYLQSRSKQPKPTPTPVAQRASYKSIVPGVSTEADLTKLLGTPIKTTINGSQKTDLFKSTSELRNHIAIVQGENVSFFKEIVSAHDTTTAKDIIDIYGAPPNTLYSKLPNSTFNLYVYPANGIAYLGHTDGTLLEIWYFQPTSIGEFITTWGTDYSFQPSTEVLQ